MKSRTTYPTTRSLRAWPSALLLGAMLALALAQATVSAAPNPNPRILPPQSHPYGHTYGEWGALWWRWGFGIGADQNPQLDPTGEFCHVGQSGPVWFLAGTFGGGDAERTCTVPAGKALFFPIINYVWVTTCVGEPRTIADIRPLVAPFIDAVETLSCEIDGVAVTNLSEYRAESPLFCTPLDLVFDLIGTDDLAAFCPGGTPNPNCTDIPNPAEHFGPADGFGPAMTDGYWLMLAPLKPGEHTIHFQASNPSAGFALDVTYHLTVN